jgi:hypothetical protein
MKKIALTLATAAGIVALSAGPASAAAPMYTADSNATSQAGSNSMADLWNASNQANQMQQASNASAEQQQELNMQMNAIKMAQAAAKASGNAG